MNTEYTYTEAVAMNLVLVIENAKDLAHIFRNNTERKEMYEKIALVNAIVLCRFKEGVYAGKEEQLFETIAPMCRHICKTWHKYIPA